MSQYVVVGAGVAGLTIAHQLTAAGRSVTVIERDAVVGGLARSWHYGDFHFDVGPHRFHTESARVSSFVREILGANAHEIPRKSGVRMFGGFHEWPLRPTVLLSMPPSLMIRAAFDLVRRERLDGESFEADVVTKYGRTLYSIFFEPYTQKFLFASPADLHRDWGRAGVNRALIDKRASADTLWSLLKTTLLPKPVETTFLYPPTGVGQFSEDLAAAIVAGGNRVVLDSPVTGLERDGRRISAVLTARERIPCDGVVWTAPISAANTMLGVEGGNLSYLSTIFYNFEIDGPAQNDFQWTYYGGDEVFSRVSSPIAFAPTMAPAGTSSLCVEVTCRQGDERWTNPEALTTQVIADLVRTRTILRAEDVSRVHIECVPFTYPIYSLDYLRQLTANIKALGQYSNLLLAGRSARFWYNNMDHSIGQGLTMSDRILKGEMLAAVDSGDREFWSEPAAAASPDITAPVAPVPVVAPGTAPVVAPTAPAPVGSGPVPARWPVTVAASLLAATVAGLAWQFGHGLGGLVYLLVFALALVPGLPVGFALFGRRHAAGWVSGALIGYVMTALALWAVIAAGVPGFIAFGGAWMVASAITWVPYRLSTQLPLVALPAWRRNDTLALLLVLFIVPGLLAPTFSNIGMVDKMGQERYRAYFTADFLWHAALTAELSKFDMPPKDPYLGDHTLNYYWSYFVLPGAAYGVNPFGVWHYAKPILKVNALLSGLLFLGILAIFAWSLVPRPAAVVGAVALSVLASSAEGTYGIFSVLTSGQGLEGLRELNIDALTAWVFESLTVDGLQRSLWYTPQHAMACALGLVALTVAGASRTATSWRVPAFAGVALAGAVMCSPFLGGMFAVIYGVSVLLTRRASAMDTVRALALHAISAVPTAAAVGWCAWNQMFDGAGAALDFGYDGPIMKAPVLMPLLTLGPILVVATAGALWGRARAVGSLAPALAGVAVGFALLYFVRLPGGDMVWVGWRAGQILLLTLTPLAALAITRLLDAKRFRPMAVATIVLVFAVGLPTTLIDTYNAQDVWNHMMGPGFRWTVVVTADQRKALEWIRRETPKDSIVQMEPTVRGRESWTLVPSFAHRRMAAGLPISLLDKAIYEDRSKRMRTMFGTRDVAYAWKLANLHGIDFIYLDSTERRAFGRGIERFEDNPRYFERVFQSGDAAVFRVMPEGGEVGSAPAPEA